MQDQNLEVVAEVRLPERAGELLKAGNLEACLALPDKTANDKVRSFVARLTASQRSLLVDALNHALGDGHGRNLSLHTRVTGYALEPGIGLEIIDATVTEEGHTGPLAIVFAHQGT
jgi:hypothetical protein